MTDDATRQRNVQRFRDLLAEIGGGHVKQPASDRRSPAAHMQRLHELRERFSTEPVQISDSLRRLMAPEVQQREAAE